VIDYSLEDHEHQAAIDTSSDGSMTNHSLDEGLSNEEKGNTTSDKSSSEHDSTQSVELNELLAFLDQEDDLSTSKSESGNETTEPVHQTEREQAIPEGVID